MRFLFDENLPARAARALTRFGHDVVLAGETHLRAQPDELLIEFCNQENRILITLDLGISELSGQLQTGLVLLRIPRRITSDEVTALLTAMLAEKKEAALLGYITVVLPGRIRSKRLEPGATTLSP